MYTKNKEKTAAIQETIFNNGPLHPLSFFDSRNYIQHNVMLEDGIGSVLELVDSLRPQPISVKVCRTLEDGDMTVAHNDYELGSWGRMIGFEVHRWEDGQIVEHWDNLQATPATSNPSGHTMTDGASEVTDIERTTDNKRLVKQFTEDLLIGRGLDGLAAFFSAGGLIQHSPLFGDGVQALRSFLEAGARTYDRLHRVLGEGNLVLTISEGSSDAADGARAATAFYDLYRCENGVIAEHWEVVEVIAPRDSWRNENGKF